MVTTRILPLVVRTKPITNAGVVTVPFSSLPWNYMHLTDIQYRYLKSSPFNPLMDRNPWIKGMRGEWGEESLYWGVQEMFPICLLLFFSSPCMWQAGLTKAGICPADARLPTGPENPLFSFVPFSACFFFFKEEEKQLKKTNKQKTYLGVLGQYIFPYCPPKADIHPPTPILTIER